jgi:hypothetical protein
MTARVKSHKPKNWAVFAAHRSARESPNQTPPPYRRGRVAPTRAWLARRLAALVGPFPNVAIDLASAPAPHFPGAGAFARCAQGDDVHVRN